MVCDKIFDVIRRRCSKEFHAYLYMEHSVLDQCLRVNVNDIFEIIEDLCYNKFHGLDGITSEHMQLADR